jgi:hypothetical protein
MDVPGTIGGRHYSTYPGEVRELKRNGKLDEAEALLLRLVDATEAESKANRWGVAPWYYEQVAIVRAKRKDLDGAIAILERYDRQIKAPGAGPHRLAQRLSQLRSKQR